MRKALKIIVPILLALTVIISVIWYLLVYDPGFTKDLLLREARRQEKNGNHNVAVMIYHVAYDQSHQDTDVAIELANQFVAAGNYTKAEYTLSKAIADGGSEKLYIALSKIYVAQDKLLDAAKMLDNISDPKIKSKLDEMRPRIPIAEPKPGFYSQYVAVDISASSGTLYVNTRGKYPSVADKPYLSPLTLPAGETTLYAMAVGDNGLVSQLGIYGYTVGGVVEPVKFKDHSIETAIRKQLNAKDDAVILTSELWNIDSFDVPEDAAQYDDLAFLPYLRQLSIHNNAASLDIIATLTNLETLDLSGCHLSAQDLQAISKLKKLESLNLSNCGISNISSLKNLTGLHNLDLSQNTIRDIDSLNVLQQLKILDLSNNALIDVSALKEHSNLETLDISYNALTSLDTLRNCPALNTLYASSNHLTSAKGIESIKGLRVLDLSVNKLTEIGALAKCLNLHSLNIARNEIKDISQLAGLEKLADLDFSYNQVTDLPEWNRDSGLSVINGSNNQIESLSALKRCQWLNYVYMDHNKITSVDALASCPRIMQVNVFGNEISDVSVLTDLHVVVNYNPL